MADLTLKGRIEEARRLAYDGRLHEALSLCRRIIVGYPKAIEPHAALGDVLRQQGRWSQAINQFLRVLSADPEHTRARAGLAAAYEREGLLAEAIWQWERVLELAPGDAEARRELPRLYRRRDGQAPRRLAMSRAALARAYLRGPLYTRAVRELETLLAAQPKRHDLQVALAEALWFAERPEAAAAVCQQVLAELPDCLKANLLLGRIWLQSDREQEGRALLRRAQALDPDNRTAQALFETHSPLPPRVTRLPLATRETGAIDLPYPLDDEDEGPVIEGHAQALPLSGEAAGALPAVQAEQRAEEAEEDRPPATDTDVAPPPQQAPERAPPERLSLLDVRRQYLRENPEDHAARLDIARRLRDERRLDEALLHYNRLVEEDYQTLTEVINDLLRLERIYPRTPAIEDCLQRARQRERYRPEP